MNKQDSDKIKQVVSDIKERLMILTEVSDHVDPVVTQPQPQPTPTPTPKPVDPPVTLPTPINYTSVLTILTAVESYGVNRQQTLISSGVPVAQSVNLRDVNLLVITDSNGNRIVADIRPAAWWDNGSIKWVQVEVVDSIQANEKKTYNLCLSKTPFVDLPLTAIKANKSAIVNTGAAEFTVGAEGLIRALKTTDGLILTGAPTSFTFDGKTDTFSDTQVRRMEFEYVGSLVCYLVVETVSNGFMAGTRISTTRRYRFVKGSSIATVTSVIKWEGTKNGTSHLMPDDKTVNGVLGTSWFDTIKLDPTTLIEGADRLDNQPLRENRKKSRIPMYQGSVLSLPHTDKKNKIVAGLQRMDLHEPQRLSYSLIGSIRIMHASDKFWLGHHQGVSTTCIIGFSDTNQKDASLLADLNHPVRLFCPPSFYNVVDKSIPSSTSPNTTKYISVLAQLCNKTLERIDKDGLYGLMTYGWWPRSWDDTYVETSEELSWDSVYKTSAFTDYYSTSRSAVTLSLMTQNSLWLDNLAHPSAQRMLWTQIMQTAPDDPWIYGGWSPAGYGCGRSDFNSSHSYYENLFWYYYLTGDRSVIDVISRGEERMINEVKHQDLAGRFPHQRLRAWRFLSQCHPDTTKRKLFLDAWVLSVKRAIDECYVEGNLNGDKSKPVALWVDGKKSKGVNKTPNIYALSIWDLETLWEYGRYLSFKSDSIGSLAESGDIAAKFVLIVRTILNYGTTLLGGKGVSVTEPWCRAFQFTWDGVTTITNLTNFEAPGEPNMYPGDLPGMCGSWTRAAIISGDAVMKSRAQELVIYTLDRIRSTNLPMCKLSGLADSTLAEAISLL